MKAAEYGKHTQTVSAFVSTNSICQGLQVPLLWPLIFETEHQIVFAHTSFKWANLPAHNAGVIVVIVAISTRASPLRKLFSLAEDGTLLVKDAPNINAYLVAGPNVIVEPARKPRAGLATMLFGNMPRDGGHFVLSGDEKSKLLKEEPGLEPFIRPYLGSEQMIQGKLRWCIWIDDQDVPKASQYPALSFAMQKVAAFRASSAASSTRDFAARPHRFVQIAGTAKKHSLAVAKVSSENREYVPVDLRDANTIISDLLFALYDAPLWNMALIASRLHIVWIAAVCGKLKTDYRYSNTLGWNTFPVPKLTDKNVDDLAASAEEILLARAAHFPASPEHRNHSRAKRKIELVVRF